MIKNAIEYFSKRVSNYGFWISISALIPLVLQAFGDVSVLPANYQEIVNCFLALLVAAGVCSDPTTKRKDYLDDK